MISLLTYSVHQLDDYSDAAVNEFAAALRRAADIVQDQWDRNPGSRFVMNAMATLKKVPRFVAEVNLHEERRTLPVTKTSSTMIGYLYTDKTRV